MTKPSIYLISPSSAVAPDAVARGRARLQMLGYRTELDCDALSQDTRFAGTDAQRVQGIMRSLDQPSPIVMCTRGGYGLTRILGQIDWQAVAASGKRFVGHSDFTAFNLALLARTGSASYSGATLVADFAAAQPDDLTEALFDEAMSDELEILSFETDDADAFDGRGLLWGGNLAVMAALVGTPYLPEVDGGILFLEDVGEHPYRVERMLTQLWHAGVLGRQQAIVLGEFTSYRLAAHDNGFDLPAVVAWLRQTVGVPVITGLPYGHVPTKATLPVGQQIGLATDDSMAYLVLQEHDHDHGDYADHDDDQDHDQDHDHQYGHGGLDPRRADAHGHPDGHDHAHAHDGTCGHSHDRTDKARRDPC